MNTFTTVAEDDWEHLTDEWQSPSGTPDVQALARRVRRRTQWMRVLVFLEVVLTTAAVVALGFAARAANSWDAWLVVGGLTVFTVIMGVFTIRNRRGTWRAAGNTLKDYRALEALRNQRVVRAALFIQRLAAVTIPLLGVLAWYRTRTSGPWSISVLSCLAAIVYLLVWTAGARVVQRRYRNAPQTD